MNNVYIDYFSQRLRRLVKPSDKWQSSLVRYGEMPEMNGAHNSTADNRTGEENTAYIQSKPSINKKYESGL